MNFVFNQSGEGNTQIGSIGKTNGPEWVRTADRLPEGGEHDEVITLYTKHGHRSADITEIGWLKLHPELYGYWMPLPKLPEVEG